MYLTECKSTATVSELLSDKRVFVRFFDPVFGILELETDSGETVIIEPRRKDDYCMTLKVTTHQTVPRFSHEFPIESKESEVVAETPSVSSDRFF